MVATSVRWCTRPYNVNICVSGGTQSIHFASLIDAECERNEHQPHRAPPQFVCRLCTILAKPNVSVRLSPLIYIYPRTFGHTAREIRKINIVLNAVAQISNVVIGLSSSRDVIGRHCRYYVYIYDHLNAVRIPPIASKCMHRRSMIHHLVCGCTVAKHK